MSIQYRKRIKVLPFFWINLSKTGVSYTIKLGPFSFSFGKQGKRVSATIPNTGLSYRKTLSRKGRNPKRD
ncbi:MAG: DUF4236 domain-containing protein [Aeromonas sp.]